MLQIVNLSQLKYTSMSKQQNKGRYRLSICFVIASKINVAVIICTKSTTTSTLIVPGNISIYSTKLDTIPAMVPSIVLLECGHFHFPYLLPTMAAAASPMPRITIPVIAYIPSIVVSLKKEYHKGMAHPMSNQI